MIRSDRLKSKTVARRFLREIRLTAGLDHPHIVRAFDAGVVGDQLYLATELVRGRDLATLVRADGPLTPAEAAQMTYQAALALQHVHERGMVHRDVKPSNLIRDDASGDVKLLDLGLCGIPYEGSTFDSHNGTITRNGMLLGTPDYISPEQAQDPHGVDIRADLYSLGCTLFYLLTGRPPFLGGSAVDRLMRHLYESPPTVAVPEGDLSEGLTRIMARLLAKRPDERFATPGALAAELQALLHPVPSGPLRRCDSIGCFRRIRPIERPLGSHAQTEPARASAVLAVRGRHRGDVRHQHGSVGRLTRRKMITSSKALGRPSLGVPRTFRL